MIRTKDMLLDDPEVNVQKARTESFYRSLVERAKGVYVGIQYGSEEGPMILFQGGPGESTCSLYLRACHSVEDVQMAIKNKRDLMGGIA